MRLNILAGFASGEVLIADAATGTMLQAAGTPGEGGFVGRWCRAAMQNLASSSSYVLGMGAVSTHRWVRCLLRQVVLTPLI
jgi:hypothetical protein